MARVIAVLNVIAWGGFWAFGYIALTTEPTETRQMMIALVLAVAGAGVGLWAYLRLVRESERRGYARPRRHVLPEHETPPGTEGGA
ncbi:hypothetical protein [Vannielia litorea]|uniref:Uncharacterized protein n=1 Tax=Vannielia litorea TaxID=1217970 RepID=A0A1N6H544_9RHOB|nr:hypothetical protein [Vannielia litorea]SIO14873.1 hypothetical protein SAMN05444002_3086 [Vannielia litorea]